MCLNPTVNFDACCHSRAKIACCSSESVTYRYSGSSIQNASEHFVSWIQLSFLTAFFIQSLKRNCNRVRSEDLNNSISVTIPNCTHVHMNFYSHNYRYYHLPKCCLSFRITLYTMVDLSTHFILTYMDEFAYIQTDWRRYQKVHIHVFYMRKYNMRYRRNWMKFEGRIAINRLSHRLTVMFFGKPVLHDSEVGLWKYTAGRLEKIDAATIHIPNKIFKKAQTN
jgi:hypothetical protein